MNVKINCTPILFWLMTLKIIMIMVNFQKQHSLTNTNQNNKQKHAFQSNIPTLLAKLSFIVASFSAKTSLMFSFSCLKEHNISDSSVWLLRKLSTIMSRFSFSSDKLSRVISRFSNSCCSTSTLRCICVISSWREVFSSDKRSLTCLLTLFNKKFKNQNHCFSFWYLLIPRFKVESYKFPAIIFISN